MSNHPINPVRRKQASRAMLETLAMAGGYALEDSILLSMVDDLVKPPLSFGEKGMVKKLLIDQGFMKQAAPDALDPEMKQWVITELGRNYLASL
jgi:hypothetical protein